ncbi:hypothetical protein SAMN04489729_0148 [Amycolatopsis lurida]|uniref:Uncharacterized protein n=1 Tax=Amycolatopsis lurida NRRL 2430 TaxID=1460371 RepID=A0A2P2FPX2_AMYLU|nr:hypothetical protein [Amycolatopsis lurida]KFU78778.1 hypothetical protein BB31_23850 [Amycolatopsis lurida NRRL 2430]SEB31710.1 hypothetical protein SAMN04489729_0148 [Amycolatopsis lurida]
MTGHELFGSEQGERARQTAMRLLAATGGAAGDFAGEVLAGRRRPHELLAHGPVLDEFVQEARGWWRIIDALPAEERQRLAGEAWSSLERQVGELATLDADEAVAELEKLSAPAQDPPPRTRRPRDDEDDDWSERSYLEPL